VQAAPDEIAEVLAREVEAWAVEKGARALDPTRAPDPAAPAARGVTPDWPAADQKG